jgi:hypothetical protein
MTGLLAQFGNSDALDGYVAMKAATVFKRGDVFYVHSESKTTEGVWIATPPFTEIRAEATASAKGDAVRDALDASKESVPHPTSHGGVVDRLLELAGVKSWAVFASNSACVTVEFDGEQLRLIPNRNFGPTGAFEPILANAANVRPQATPDELWTAIEERFTLYPESRAENEKDGGQR